MARKRGRGRESQPDTSSGASAGDEPGAVLGDEEGGGGGHEGATFAVAGIGASAGGIETLRELFAVPPDDTGVAYVVIQHLAPLHASMLARTLGAATSMPVAEVTEPTRVVPDHVYVIPPAHDLTIRQGVLQLVDREPRRHMAVDRFFRSLAEDQQTRAIGIVLSGTGADGALGLQAIRAEGGITFAQDPRTALHDGMPRSAVATGVVDFVLPVAGIAEELKAQGSLLEGLNGVVESSQAGREDGAKLEILRLLQRNTGADFSRYKQTTLARRLARRLAILKLPNLRAYVDHLIKVPDELEALREDILVHVTSFFRDPEAFDALKRLVFPEVLHNKEAGAAIRIWAVGCSTGEEAYSLGMTLIEFLDERGASQPIQIFGSDMSDRAIQFGRTGLYPESIAEQVGEQRLQRFFTRTEGGFRVSKALRDLCVFVKHDLTRDPPFSRIDLIACRNVLIYFEPGLQQRVVPLLHYGLAQPGFLMLGKSESLSGYGNLFTMVDKDQKIYGRRLGAGRPQVAFPMQPGVAGAPLRPRGPVDPARLGLDLQRAADHILLSRFAPPGVLVTEDYEILQFRGRTGPYLEPAPGQASFGLLKMAREGLTTELQRALEQAKRENVSVTIEQVAIRRNDHTELVNVEVIPIRDLGTDVGRHYLVLFQDAPATAAVARKRKAADVMTADSRTVTELRQELAAARTYLQTLTEQHTAVTEELTASNEELQSSNEELQSTNEELETAKEELQSSNEELATVNYELQMRNQELDQLNDDLLNLLASVDIPVVIVDEARRVRRFTPSARQMFNVLPTDVGRPIAELRPNVEPAELDEAITQVVSSVTTREWEVRDRAGRWHRLLIRPYLTSDKRVDGAVITVIDIDKLRRALEAATAARDRATAVIETVALPLVVLDDALGIVSSNRSFRDLFPVHGEPAPATPVGRLLGGMWQADGLVSLLRQAIDRGVPFEDIEHEADIPPLGMRTLLLTGRPVAGEDGGRLLLLGLQDVTRDRRREDERVRERAEKAQRFLNEVGSVLLAESIEFPVRLDRLAPLLLPLLGDWCVLSLISEDGVVQHVAASHADPGRKGEVRELQWLLASSPKPAAGVVQLARSGEVVDVPTVQASELAEWFGLPQSEPLAALGAESLLAVPVQGRSAILGALTLVRALSGQAYTSDLTALALAVGQRVGLAVENARLFQAARDASAMRDAFLGVASHELRTPLTALQLQLQRLKLAADKGGGKAADARAGGLDRALDQVERMARLIENLLVVSRLSEGPLELEIERVDLAALVRDTVARMRGEAEKVESELLVNAPGPVVGAWDPLRLEQVVVSLVGNAFRHAPGAAVRVEVEQDEHEARLVVHDVGPGIEPGRHEVIFERFETAASTYGAGLGLGLFITRRIVEAHGGTIRVDSEPGRGSTFTVRLPLRRPGRGTEPDA